MRGYSLSRGGLREDVMLVENVNLKGDKTEKKAMLEGEYLHRGSHV